MEAFRDVAPWIGYAAGALTVIAFLPQALRVWRTRQTHDLSRRMFMMLITAGGLWITYGVLQGDWPLIATNIGAVCINGVILTAKLRHG